MQKLCGQAYDGAGAMAGARRGVAARILDKYPKAGFVHCASHVLNLCVLKSASIAEVRNVMDVVTSVANFFNHSPKRQVTLDKFITEFHHRDAESSKRRKLKDLCKTRFVERHDAFEVFVELYESTVHCLEEIVDPTVENAWNKETVSDARSHLRALTEFKFLTTLCITKNILAYTKGLSVQLQGKWQDIIRAYNNIEAVKKVLQDARSKVEVFHTKWFDESTLLASKVNLEPSIPRRACHQVQHSSCFS